MKQYLFTGFLIVIAIAFIVFYIRVLKQDMKNNKKFDYGNLVLLLFLLGLVVIEIIHY